MARDFDGVDDNVKLALGNLGFTATAVSIAVIARPDTDQSGTTRRNLLSVGASGSLNELELQRDASETIEIRIAGNTQGSTTTWTAADGWAFVAACKSAGSTAPRFHFYKYAAGTWTRETAGGNLADGPSSFSTEATLGTRGGGSRPWDGQIAVAAVWDRALSDSDTEGLPFSLRAWLASSPRGLWLLDQSATTQTVVDLTGGGANESALTGTVVATQSVPVFSYGFDVLFPSRFADAVVGIPYLVAARRN